MAPLHEQPGGTDAGQSERSRDDVKQALAASSLLRGAQRFARAAEMLATKDSTMSPSLALLASHGLELALKAYLIYAGSSQHYMKAIGSNLLEGWTAAVDRGLALTTPAPAWCQYLSAAYDYPSSVLLKDRDTPNNALNASGLVADLNGVVTTVEEALRGPSGP